jgi:hypothetical protein
LCAHGDVRAPAGETLVSCVIFFLRPRERKSATKGLPSGSPNKSHPHRRSSNGEEMEGHHQPKKIRHRSKKQKRKNQPPVNPITNRPRTSRPHASHVNTNGPPANEAPPPKSIGSPAITHQHVGPMIVTSRSTRGAQNQGAWSSLGITISMSSYLKKKSQCHLIKLHFQIENIKKKIAFI